MDRGTIFISYFLICGITNLILWIRMLMITDSKGYRVTYLLVYPGQYSTFWKIAKNEEDPFLRKKYKRLFWIQMGILIAYPVGMISLFNIF